MPPTKTETLEIQLEQLGKDFGGARDAIRRLSEGNRDNLSLLQQLREELDKIKMEVARLRFEQEKKLHHGGVERY